MESTAHAFKENVGHALADPNLQDSLAMLKVGFSERRRQATERLPEFEALRDRARDIKNHTLAHLDFYLEEFERKVIGLGGKVHWAPTAADARRIIAELCQSVNAQHRRQVEVDGGRGDRAQRASRGDWASRRSRPISANTSSSCATSRPATSSRRPSISPRTRSPIPSWSITRKLGFDKRLTERNDLVAEARYVLRQKFLDADVGLTGANFLVAETGSSMLVTNEGNADLSNTLPKMHIVLASIEKVIPTLEDAAVLLRVLARSATGQEILGLYDAEHRAEEARGSRRARAVSRRAARQRTLLRARHRDAGDPALHPLRRLHEPLPGLRRRRRPRLRLGLSRPDGRGADAAARGRRGGEQPAQRLDLLRPLRERLPGAHPAAEADAPLARARVREAPDAQGRAAGPGGVELRRPPAGALSPPDRIANRVLALFGRADGRYSALPLAGGWTRFRDFPAPQPGGTFHAQWAKRKA